MPENKDYQNYDDFSANNFIKRNQHNRDISGIKKRLEDLESRIGSDADFAETFRKAQEHEKKIDEAIERVINQYDNHKIKLNGIALLKWLGVLIIGGIIGAFIKSYFP